MLNSAVLEFLNRSLLGFRSKSAIRGTFRFTRRSLYKLRQINGLHLSEIPLIARMLALRFRTALFELFFHSATARFTELRPVNGLHRSAVMLRARRYRHRPLHRLRCQKFRRKIVKGLFIS